MKRLQIVTVQKGIEYAILTDEISRAWSGMSTREYKKLKGLKKENLRDNMTTTEIVARKALEQRTGRSVVSSQNASQLNKIVVDVIEGVIDDNRA